MKEEEEKALHARIRANERLSREYEEIGDITRSLRCRARVKALKSELARKMENSTRHLTNRTHYDREAI